MHYALEQWFDIVYKKQCRGECGLVIFADDFVATFQYESEAKKFLSAVAERFALFGLELEPSKTRLIEFGRFAAIDRKARGQGKPDTFDFLGFTHYCSKGRTGHFRVKRKTISKKLRLKLTEINLWIKQNRHLRLKELFTKINQKLKGHYQYYGITDNSPSLNSYLHHVESMIFKWLNRRSQRKSYKWVGFKDLLKLFPLAKPCITVNIYG